MWNLTAMERKVLMAVNTRGSSLSLEAGAIPFDALTAWRALKSTARIREGYDSRNSILEWSIVLIDASNRSGSLEFVVPAVDPSSFFPISARFSSSKTFSDLKTESLCEDRQVIFSRCYSALAACTFGGFSLGKDDCVVPSLSVTMLQLSLRLTVHLVKLFGISSSSLSVEGLLIVFNSSVDGSKMYSGGLEV
nr:coatomer subunit delta-like [Ipomoea batatas]